MDDGWVVGRWMNGPYIKMLIVGLWQGLIGVGRGLPRSPFEEDLTRRRDRWVVGGRSK